MLRGPKGTEVRVTVKREGAPDFVTNVVTRGAIETSVVDAFWWKPGIVYLRIDSFEAQNVSQDVEDDLHKLGEQNVNGMILDLRGNPGGLVNEAVAVAGRFLRDGQIVVSHRGRAEQEQVFRAKAIAPAQKYPIVVLVDSRSASAAEIVSGALQDHDRAWILGDTTFGKGLVQAQFPLSEGAALLLTIAHYYTPSGRLIQRDYSHESFLDYYYAKHDGVQNTQDIKSTDSGRKVYGGGGITPDEKYPGAHYNLFQRRWRPYYDLHVLPLRQCLLRRRQTGCPRLAAGRRHARPLQAFPEVAGNFDFTDANSRPTRIGSPSRSARSFTSAPSTNRPRDRAQWLDDPECKKAIESMPARNRCCSRCSACSPCGLRTGKSKKALTG